mmetsp:Transcript_26356/g.78255  ORF Transcript_26356/g.78255 Transcript_26356/m.78255 type:complete len:236 (+) Transcript_26356:922-1629(+)
MERHAHNVEAQLLSHAEQRWRLRHLSAVLQAQWNARCGVVRADAQHQLEVRVERSHLVQLRLCVKGRELHAVRACKADVACTLARVSKDDARRVDTHVEHRLQLVLRRAVKASAHGVEQAQHAGLRVALDSVERRHAGQCSRPCTEHALHVAEVDDVEVVLQLVIGNMAAGNFGDAISTAMSNVLHLQVNQHRSSRSATSRRVLPLVAHAGQHRSCRLHITVAQRRLRADNRGGL